MSEQGSQSELCRLIVLVKSPYSYHQVTCTLGLLVVLNWLWIGGHWEILVSLSNTDGSATDCLSPGS